MLKPRSISEVWIFDLRNDRLLFFRSLGHRKYEEKTSTLKPGLIPIAELLQVSIGLSRLLEG